MTASYSSQSSSDTVFYTDATVQDPGSNMRVPDGVLAVRDGVVTAVGARGEFPDRLPGIERRLGGGYLSPGLFNCHAHLALDGDDTPYVTKLPVLTSLPEEQRVVGYLEQARINLAWGVTSVRDLHPGPAGTLAGFRTVQRLTDSAAFPGARVFLATRPLVVAGGHGTHWMSRSVSGVDEVVRAVRETVQDGADCIKLMTAHAWGPLPDEPSSWATYFTEEELHAAVTTAHGFGVPVAAHCHGETALRSVINAGVDSIEHGSGLTRELAKLMAANGTFLVPTLASYDNISARGEAGGLTGGRIEQAKWVRNRQREGLTLAMEEGVAIAAGSDAGFHMLPHGESLIRELELYAELGMTPLDVLRTATSNAARLVGVADQLGSLAVGKKADFIVSEADPLLDLSNLRQLSLVSLGGVTYEPRTLRKPLMSPGARLREGRRTHVANELQNAVR